MIDCFFIGHNDMNFNDYVKIVKKMGSDSGAYRDLNLNFLEYRDRYYSAMDIYNEINKEANNGTNVELSESVSLTMAYLASYINKRGLSFDFINNFQKLNEKIINKLKNNEIRTIVIPTTLYVAPFPILEIISLVRKYSNTVKIIIGGPFIFKEVHYAENEEQLQWFLKSLGADVYVYSSQGEEALCRVLNAIKENKTLHDIPNIYYWDVDKYVGNSVLIESNNLEENLVDWSLFKDNIKDNVITRTSISCPFSCSFCGFPQHAGKYYFSSVESIEKDLNTINNLGKVKSIEFIDDTFNVPKERFKEILRMIIKNKYSFKWHSHFRCQFADKETIELMKESGCEGVFLGIESGSQRILNNMNKKVELEKYREGMRLLNEYGIMTYASFILGFPGETKETIQETINFIKETKPTFYRMQLWYCDPITPIWKQKEDYGLKGSQFNWSHNTMNSSEACDEIEKIFCELNSSIWVPQNNFEIQSIYNLLSKGMSLDKIKQFLLSFNLAIKDKLYNKDVSEISYYSLENIKKVLSNVHYHEHAQEASLDIEFEF